MGPDCRKLEMFFIRVYQKMIFLGGELGCTINDIFGLDNKWGIGNYDYVMLFSWHSQKIRGGPFSYFQG